MSKKDAFLQFLKAARSLQNRGLSKEAILQFAKNEFGELSELFKKQIDNLFKPKKGIENIKIKDEVFDDTVINLPIDDTGVPFNPNDPLKEYGKPKKAGKGQFTKAEYLIQRLKNTIKENPDDKYVQENFPNFVKEIEANPDLAKNENVFKELGEDLPSDQKITVYDDDTLDFARLKPTKKFRLNVEKFKKDFNVADDEMERIIKLSSEDQQKVLQDYINKDFGQQIELSDFDVTDLEPNAEGGRAGYYGGGQAMIEPDLSDIGHGSDALMARTRITAPGSQATTSTGLNYLLGEDNDNIRVPFNNGLLVPPAKPYTEEMFKDESMTLLKGMYGTGPESNKFLYNEMIKKGNKLREQGVERETVIEIIRNNKDKINAFLETQTGNEKSLAGLANGGRIGFQDGLSAAKKYGNILVEDENLEEMAGKELLKKIESFKPNETKKEKEEREMFNMVKEFQKFKRANPNSAMTLNRFVGEKKKEKELFKNTVVKLDLKYPEKEIINKKTNMVDTEKLKEAVDQAEIDLEISPIDGLNLKRTINTEGEQSVTSGSFSLDNLTFSSPNLEEGQLTTKGNYTFGDLDLSGMVDSNDGQILNTELGFNYDNMLKGKLNESDGYRSTELDLNKTFPISDKFNLNLTGDLDTRTFNGETYRSSDLKPTLSYNDGILSADISKSILEGGDTPNLNVGASFPLFEKTFTGDLILNEKGEPTYNSDGSLRRKSDYSTDMGVVTLKGTDLFTDNMGGTIGYQKNILDKDNLKFSIGGEMDPFTGEKTAGGYLKYNFAGGGIAGLRQGYSKGKGVDLARRGFLKVLGATAAGVAAFKSGVLKVLGKTEATKAVPKIVEIGKDAGAPSWFEPMVNKVLADGLDVTKKNAYVDGQTVKRLDTPNGKVDVYHNERTGEIDVDYMGSGTALDEGVQMNYKPGMSMADEGNPRPADEFFATESVPEGQVVGPGDYEIGLGENTVSDVKGLYSDTLELEELGGQNPLIKDISNSINKKRKLKQMKENPSDFVTDVQGDYDPT